jgi:hypothetical protein
MAINRSRYFTYNGEIKNLKELEPLTGLTIGHLSTMLKGKPNGHDVSDIKKTELKTFIYYNEKLNISQIIKKSGFGTSKVKSLLLGVKIGADVTKLIGCKDKTFSTFNVNCEKGKANKQASLLIPGYVYPYPLPERKVMSFESQKVLK